MRAVVKLSGLLAAALLACGSSTEPQTGEPGGGAPSGEAPGVGTSGTPDKPPGTQPANWDPCAAFGLCTNESVTEPSFRRVETIVPSAKLPAGLSLQQSNNNLDIAYFDDRLFLAFRNASHHHPRADAELIVVSTKDLKTFDLEARIQSPDDLREPQLVVHGGALTLYYARVKAAKTTFEPLGMSKATRVSRGAWSPPAEVFDPGLLVWRMKELGGSLSLLGYTNVGGLIGNGDIEVWWMKSQDGVTFADATASGRVMLQGGASETDAVMLDDGSLVAVSRNETGDSEGRFGMKICTAPAGDLGNWTCKDDRKKYDSPLLFKHGSHVYLVGRKNVTDDGTYDLDHKWLPTNTAKQAAYIAVYWNKPKRCALWEVDPATRDVSHMLDLPTRGDTCFAEVLPLGQKQMLLFDYTSPPDGPDYSWREGQNNPTEIYYGVLTLP